MKEFLLQPESKLLYGFLLISRCKCLLEMGWVRNQRAIVVRYFNI